jgi:antitoxin component YwqK of YwqJK toxin-antitoxin module
MSWIPYDNGKLNGCGARFDEDGNPIEGAEYKNNVINGVYCSYYPQNKLHWLCNFENGMLNGEALQYDRYGNHLLTLQYKDNKLHGECIDHVTNTSCEYYMGIKK